MSDIVERLRASHPDAADEIERLRGILEALVEWNERNGTYGELPPLITWAKTVLRQR